MLRLAIICAGKTAHFEIPEGVWTLGADGNNKFVVSCSGVSGCHAEVQRSGNQVMIRDLGSKNGLVVGGQRHAEVWLMPETAVLIGRAVVRLEVVDRGDAQVALPISGPDDDNQMHRGSTTTSILLGEDVPVRLIEWIRKMEAGLWSKSAAFEEARRVLDATTLLLHKGRAIREIAGPLPPDEVLRDLGSGVGFQTLTATGAASELSAYFADGVPSSSWHGEFLEFLYVKFGGLQEEVPRPSQAGELIFAAGVVRGSSSAMASVYDVVRQAAESDVNVLLLGESGTGKEVIAQVMHDSDRTRRGAFIPVNTTAVPAEMLEAELFGVERRAATNVDPRPGYFRRADRGTILLDEIGDMPLALQAKLLRVVEDHVVTPLGASRSYPVDVRVIAATNHVDLSQLVADGRFRRDLFYRLNSITIHVPPLRMRQDDLPAFIVEFVKSAASRARKTVVGVSPNAFARLRDHSWPGNLRELKQVVERAVRACPNGAAIESSHIGTLVTPSGSEFGGSLKEQTDAAERRAIIDALERTGGSRTRAAEILNISRAALHNKLRLFGIK